MNIYDPVYIRLYICECNSNNKELSEFDVWASKHVAVLQHTDVNIYCAFVGQIRMLKRNYIHTVQHLDIIKVLFIHQLMHQWVVLKRTILNFTFNHFHVNFNIVFKDFLLVHQLVNK